jgi:hypothetical protein
MFTPRTFSRKTLRIFSISFDKEWQPNIVEVAKGQKNLPAGFPVEKFLEQYRLWKQAMKSSDPEEKNSMTSLYADLREMHQAAGLNKWTGSVFASNEEMEIFGEFLEWLKGTRITNLPVRFLPDDRVYQLWQIVHRLLPSLDPHSISDMIVNMGNFIGEVEIMRMVNILLPTEGAYVQESRQWDKAIVIWNKDQNLIHSIIIDGVQYIGKDGAFRNAEGENHHRNSRYGKEIDSSKLPFASYGNTSSWGTRECYPYSMSTSYGSTSTITIATVQYILLEVEQLQLRHLSKTEMKNHFKKRWKELPLSSMEKRQKFYR